MPLHCDRLPRQSLLTCSLAALTKTSFGLFVAFMLANTSTFGLFVTSILASASLFEVFITALLENAFLFEFITYILANTKSSYGLFVVFTFGIIRHEPSIVDHESQIMITPTPVPLKKRIAQTVEGASILLWTKCHLLHGSRRPPPPASSPRRFPTGLPPPQPIPPPVKFPPGHFPPVTLPTRPFPPPVSTKSFSPAKFPRPSSHPVFMLNPRDRKKQNGVLECHALLKNEIHRC